MKSSKLILLAAVIIAAFWAPSMVNAAEGDYIGVWTLDALNDDPTGLAEFGGVIYIADDTDDKIYEYDTDGVLQTSWALNALNVDPMGVGSNSTHVYVADDVDDDIYVYLNDGTFVELWPLHALNTDAYGVTTNGTYIWVVDKTADRVFWYTMEGVYVSSKIYPAFPPNITSYGMTTNGITLWIVNTFGNIVEKWNTTIDYQGNWTLNALNGLPRGMGHNGSRFMVVDNADDAVYMYETPPHIPVNEALDSTASFGENQFRWVNATVSDAFGVLDLSTVTIQVNTTGDAESFTLRWYQNNNTFAEISDTSNICTLGTSIRVNVNGTIDRIAFNFSISGGTYGDCDVKLTTVDSSSSDVDTYANEFEFVLSYGPFTFSDTYYENGTLYVPPVNVSVTGDGFSDEFNTSGGASYYYIIEPVAFSWNIGGGMTRYIYEFLDAENFTVTVPDGTDYVYSFTVRDFTGKLGEGQGYLEAWRTINGTETLIERMPIQQPNPVSLNLVYGKTYHLYVLFADGTRFNWGYFVATGDTTMTIILRDIEFSDGAQVLYNHISVEASRSGGVITVNYLDDQDNTIWANVTISIRNGGVVATYARSNASYTINYAGFNDSLGYIVTFTGYHSDFGVWGRTFILDQVFTFPDAPSLTGIFGAAMANFIPFMLTCITILVFPVSMQPIGLLGGGVTATLMSFFGWATWSVDLLYFYWFIAILVNLVVRGRGS